MRRSISDKNDVLETAVHRSDGNGLESRGSGARLMMQLALTSGGGYSRSVKCLQRVATANVNRPSLLPPARLLTY